MKLPRSKKARRRMFGLIFLYSGIILSLGTSTMAWYSVQANVNIDVESASITIKTPFQYHFYAYKGNFGFVADPTEPGTGYKTATLSNLQNISNYKEINELQGGQTVDSDYNSRVLTTVDGLWPGYSMSFAIKAEGLATGTGGDRPILKIIKGNINPGDGAANEIVQKRYIGAETTTHLCLAQAMQISAWSGDDIQNMTAATPMTALNKQWWLPSKQARTGEDAVDTEPEIGLGQAAANHEGSWWWFFTVTFSDDSSTYYKEMTTPPADDDEIHYQKDADNGNSSCYEGLTFKLGEMTLKNPGS